MSDVARQLKRAGSGRYSTVAILLHWLIAAAIVLQVVLAGRMEPPPTPQTFAVTQLHKSVGITILLLSLARLGWRLIHPPPPLPDTMARWERVASKVVHVGFYVVMIGMPLTGWIMVSASRNNVPTLLYGVVHWPYFPGVHDLAPAAKKLWHDFGETAHGALAKFLYGLLALHVAGALKHQLFSRDEPVLARMAPGAAAGRWLEPRILAILLAAGGVIGFGRLVTPPAPNMAPRATAAPAPLQTSSPAAPTPVATPAPVAAPTAAAEMAPSAEAKAAAPAAPVRWTVSPGSTLGFATAWSGQALEGRFQRWRADILFSPAALEASKVTVTVDVGSADTGDAQRDAALPAPDWFDSAAHPQAVFSARSFSRTGPDRYLAKGTLSLRGVSRPLALPFSLKITGDKARVSGVTTLDRTAFGVGQGEWASTDQIPAKVTVRVNLEARRS